MDGALNLSLHALIAPAGCAVLAHIVCHHWEPSSIVAFIAVLALPPLTITSALGPSFSMLVVLQCALIYLGSLCVSIVAYRLSPFHPLAQYPGPVLARVSRLWATREVIKESQHITSHILFERYGDVVRTGPNHLIIRDVAAIPVIHGTKDQWPRHARYSMGRDPHSHGSILGIISPGEHGKRRRVWDRAFTPAAIISYNPMLHARLGQLLCKLEQRRGQPVDLAEWFGFFSLDFMGDFAYGGMFDFMAREADTDGFHKFTVQVLGMGEVFGTIPWTNPFLQALPSPVQDYQAMALNVVKKRMNSPSQMRDLFHYLLNEDGESNHAAMNTATLTEESVVAIIAGSDTTATALANAVFYLISEPHVLTRLRAELDAAAGEGAPYEMAIAADRLPHLKYLQAIINETLRLHPAVPNGIQRTAPHGSGFVPVAGYPIPAGTSVQIPTWSLHRDPRYFAPHSSNFWPERWLPEEGPKIAEAQGLDFKLTQMAYMPFHYGPANCVGRALALHELRTVLAALVRRFDLAFAPGYEEHDWIDQLKDQFILVRGRLSVVMTERQSF